MIRKYNRSGVLLLMVGILIIVLAMAARRFPLLASFGPKDWFQYFIAMLGFLGVGAGFYITILTSGDEIDPYRPFSIIIILGGLYVFIMGFVLVVHNRMLIVYISGLGLIGVAIGLLYFFEVEKRFAFLRRNNPDVVKILILAWMAGLLICFLLYWGAPVEFWEILGRFGVNVNKDGLLKSIQNFLMRFFSYT